MNDALIDQELGANRIALAQRRLKRLFSDTFDEVHALKAYLNIHPVTEELVDDFAANVEYMAEEFQIDMIINGGDFYKD